MFLVNYWLSNLVYEIVLVLYQIADAGRIHPVRERALRSLASTVDYVEARMPNALGFGTAKALLAYAINETNVHGHYLEFGVFSGGSIRYLAKLRRDQTFHGFDSFQGLPESWAGTRLQRSTFSKGGKAPRVPRNVTLHKGWFSKTLPLWRETFEGPLAFVHIDCDLYSSTADIFSELGDRLQPGSVIVFDEYFNYPNWQEHEFKAWQEFVASHGVRYEYLAYARYQVAVRVTQMTGHD
jgi:predicted O-methyltransferase YrrM